MADYMQVVTTTSNRRNADAIARILISKRLAGCVQILGPMESIFMWKGKMEKENEWICLIKTKKSAYKKVESEIISLHEYTTPEILAFPITHGYKKYLHWLEAYVR